MTRRAPCRAAAGRRLRPLVNATGIFLHTNLGRAPLPRAVARRLPALLDAYCDLEIDRASGRRGERNRRVERLLTAATGAARRSSSTTTPRRWCSPAALARDREVVVSRGELIEIGGSFRIPEIMAAAGARLVEVGATNRTRLADYRAAVGRETALLLKVFPSNFRQIGFVAAVEPAELADLGRAAGIPTLVDEGSGLLRPSTAPQLAGHPSLATLVATGIDLACGSGDKLLGGPQAGLLVGRADLLARCREHPLYRALRPDRTALAALEGVLRLHLARAPLPIDRLWRARGGAPAAQGPGGGDRRRNGRCGRDRARRGLSGRRLRPRGADRWRGPGARRERRLPGPAPPRPGAPPARGRLSAGGAAAPRPPHRRSRRRLATPATPALRGGIGPLTWCSVVATAGHVDHGKSTLGPRAHALLAGPVPGGEGPRPRPSTSASAWTARCPPGATVGFVDVPGHDPLRQEHARRASVLVDVARARRRRQRGVEAPERGAPPHPPRCSACATGSWPSPRPTR